jgi:hypothetical protein
MCFRWSWVTLKYLFLTAHWTHCVSSVRNCKFCAPSRSKQTSEKALCIHSVIQCHCTGKSAILFLKGKHCVFLANFHETSKYYAELCLESCIKFRRNPTTIRKFQTEIPLSLKQNMVFPAPKFHKPHSQPKMSYKTFSVTIVSNSDQNHKTHRHNLIYFLMYCVSFHFTSFHKTLSSWKALRGHFLHGDTRWHSGWDTALQTGRSRDRLSF